MGDRATVLLKGNDNSGAEIVLYTHWNGSNVEKIVAAGLKAAIDGGRNTDQSYGQRIVVEAFFAAHDDKVTGAGIWAGLSHSESHEVTVDFDEQTVEFDPDGNEYGGQKVTEPFAAFVERFVPAEVDA